MDNTLITLFQWATVLTIPLIYTVHAIPPDMKLMIYSVITPLLLAFISRQATFAGINERVIVATSIAVFVITYAISKAIKPVREALKNPSEKKNRLTFILSYVGMIILYAMIMYGASIPFGIYKNTPGAI